MTTYTNECLKIATAWNRLLARGFTTIEVIHTLRPNMVQLGGNALGDIKKNARQMRRDDARN